MSTRVARVDRWQTRLDADIPLDSRGFALLWGTVISADQVLEYGPLDGHPDGHLELVPESTVFDEEAMATLKNAPITFLHPQEPVSADNSVRLTVGHIVDVKRDGNRLRALHQIEDAQTLAKIRGGVVELSPGYTTELEDAAGMRTDDGRTVNAIQRGRVYNHQAVVPEARAGHENALSIDARILPADGLRIQIKGAIMKTFKKDGKSFEVDEAVFDLLTDLTSKLTGGSKGDAEGDDPPDDEDEEEDGKKGDAEGDEASDKAEDGKPDTAKPDAPLTPATDSKPIDVAALTKSITDGVLKAVKKDRSEAQASATRTATIVNDARSVLPQSYSFEGKSDADIMRAAIKERDPDAVTRAKALKGDGLHGFFTAIVSAAPRRDSSVPANAPKHADARAMHQERIDAVVESGLTGDSAVKCDAVMKLGRAG